MQSKEQQSRAIIDRVSDLATLPTIVTKVVAMMDCPGTSTKDIERVLRNDQVFTSKLLKLVNSSFYGFSRKIDRVSDAIVLLGFNVLRNLVLTASIFDFRNYQSEGMRTAVQKLWEHSIHCGITAKHLSHKLRFSDPNEAFVGGILHDIGKVVICQYLKKDLGEIFELKEKEHLSMREAEKKVLGITHCEIGRRFAEKFNLPERLTEVIACHHSPSVALVAPKLVALIHIANEMCGSDSDPDMILSNINPCAIEKLQLAEDSLRDFISESTAEVQDICNTSHSGII